MGLRFPNDPSLIALLASPHVLNSSGEGLLKSLFLIPKALKLLPRHETPRLDEALEKLVRNLSEDKNVSFAENPVYADGSE